MKTRSSVIIEKVDEPVDLTKIANVLSENEIKDLEESIRRLRKNSIKRAEKLL